MKRIPDPEMPEPRYKIRQHYCPPKPIPPPSRVEREDGRGVLVWVILMGLAIAAGLMYG